MVRHRPRTIIVFLNVFAGLLAATLLALGGWLGIELSGLSDGGPDERNKGLAMIAIAIVGAAAVVAHAAWTMRRR